MAGLEITAVKVFSLQPRQSRLGVVKVTTSEPGLYGLGCATFTQRQQAVAATIEHHIGPFVTGRDPRAIEDLWRGMMLNGYWRNGPVLNCAVAGVDMALWDILGKLAGMPCYQLWGGACRPAAAIYVHCDGPNPAAVAEQVRRRLEQGIRHVRCQLGGYAGLGAAEAARAEPGSEKALPPRPDGAPAGGYFDPAEKLRSIPELFNHLRSELGDEPELLHDVHERLAPPDAARLAKALEPYRLFFLEDVVAPEDLDWLEHIRRASVTPIAMGELFNRMQEITPLLSRRLIDFIRVHISQLGGITPALKLARLCEAFGVRTAWHGPGDLTPIGMAANLHLDLACPNFGIQEWTFHSEAELALFPGTPEVRGGYAYPDASPGLGVDFDEALATKYPCDEANPTWTTARLPDGTLWTP